MRQNNTITIELEDGHFAPAYSRVADLLKQDIRNKRWAHGSKLPTEPLLAKELGISRVTLRHALQILEQQKLIHRRRGKNGGAFICSPDETVSRIIKNVGLLVNIANPENEPYFLGLLNGIRRELDMGTKLLLVKPDGKDILETYNSNGLDGILIIGASRKNIKLFEDLNSYAIPHVIINERINSANSNVVWVDTDNLTSSRAGTQYLLDLGHERIAHIGGFQEYSNSQDRLNGYKDALGEAGLAIDPSLIYTPERGEERKNYAYNATMKLLSLKNPPTAIFTAGFLFALEAMSVIKNRGLRVPEDISLLGFDDFSVGEYLTPPLTTIRQPLEELGEKAAEMIQEWLNFGCSKESRVVLPNELIIRKSCTTLK